MIKTLKIIGILFAAYFVFKIGIVILEFIFALVMNVYFLIISLLILGIYLFLKYKKNEDNPKIPSFDGRTNKEPIPKNVREVRTQSPSNGNVIKDTTLHHEKKDLTDASSLFEKEIENNKTSFSEFVKNYRDTKLKDIVDNSYKKYSTLSSNRDIGFGVSGANEFVGALLLDEYNLGLNLNSQIDKAIRKVFQKEYSPLQFSEHMDVIIKNSSVPYDEWSSVYRYLRDYHSWIQQHQCSNENEKVHPVVEDFEKKYREKAIWWNSQLENMTLKTTHYKVMKYLGPCWYPSSYACSCEEQLYKTVFPVGEEYELPISAQETWHIKRAFTCPQCRKTQYPRPGFRLSDPHLTLSFPSEKDYLESIMLMGAKSTTVGRADV